MIILNNYLKQKVVDIINSKQCKGLSRKNIDLTDFQSLLNLFSEKAPLRFVLEFYVDFDNCIQKKLTQLFHFIKTEHLEFILNLIIKENLIIQTRLHSFEKEKENIIFNFFKTNDFKIISKLLKAQDKFCNVCGNFKSIISTEGLLFCNCDFKFKCEKCNKTFLSLKAKKEHYSREHKLNYNKINLPKEVHTFCIFCKQETESYITKNYYITAHHCTNKNCFGYYEVENKRLTNFKIAIKNRPDDFSTENYKKAAFIREKEFKNTILENGLNKKQEITKRSSKKISSKIKEKIKSGEFTPCITNSWCRSKIKYKDLRFRSSWEALFFLINNNLKYEKTRIMYYDTKSKKFRNYIVDFTDDNENILYEIKPSSENEDQQNLDKKKYAEEYCKNNNLQFKIINENYFIKNIFKIEENYLENKMNFSYESQVKIERTIKKFKKEFQNENYKNF